MAEIYGPFDSGPGATFGEDGWNKLMRACAGDGIIFQYATEITTPYVGPEENALRVTAAGGLDYAVNVGLCNNHGHLYENTTSLTRTVSTPGVTAGQSRNDIVVVRMDKTANTMTVTTITGTNAVTPTDPAIQRTPTLWDVPLARINVPANAVNIGTITDLRAFAYIPPELMPPAPKKSGTSTGNIVGTEVKDATIGDYQFRAFPGRQYRICANIRIQADAVPTAVDVRIRDSGSASSPSTGSTLLVAISDSVGVVGGSGASSRLIQKPITGLTASIHTIALFAVRTAGSGNVILGSPAGETKDLWVEDITKSG
jgi:hypothetical protein